MLKCRKMLAFLTVVLIFGSLILPTFADDFDANHLGSLEVHILDTKTKQGVPGGVVEIYQVTKVKAESGLFIYTLTDAFSASGFDVALLDNLSASQNAEQAKKLAAFAAEHHVAAVSMSVPDKDGAVKFKDLPLGTYLVVQSQAASKREEIDPFIITVPQIDGENYVYDVDAAPKTGTSDVSPTTTAPTRPSGNKLPQTGQLWWPVYVLTSVGLACFMVGIYCRKRNSHE